ncbi:MAG: translation initiation factor IF-3, partial [Phycisphaeraceae bacterium]|nr:translation initiation factor IF-3 [Phycisphaeraceae bacterium]
MARRFIIGRRRFQSKKKDTGKRLRINERIRVSPVRLIGDDNEQIGVIETEKAIQMAKDKELDLVEVSPNSDPPVCRIMDYGKWKYQQSKKEHQAKTKSKQTETKEVRLRPSTEENDLRIKLERAKEFFDEGHKVQFTILFRGRQNAHKEIGFRIFSEIADHFEQTSHVEMLPRIQGRRMTMLMTPGVKTNAPKIRVPEPRHAPRPPEPP